MTYSNRGGYFKRLYKDRLFGFTLTFYVLFNVLIGVICVCGGIQALWVMRDGEMLEADLLGVGAAAITSSASFLASTQRSSETCVLGL